MDEEEAAAEAAAALPYEDQLELVLDRYPTFANHRSCFASFSIAECAETSDLFLQFWFRLGKFVRDQCVTRASQSTWSTSYRPIFLQAALQLDALTAEYREWYLKTAFQIAKYVEEFPVGPTDLLQEVQHCLQEQRTQFQAQLEKWEKEEAKAAEKDPAQETSTGSESGNVTKQEPNSKQPKPEKMPPTILQEDRKSFLESGTVRVAPSSLASSDVLSSLPTSLVGITPSGIEPLKLANPLPLASSECGYVCDMCNRKNVAVAYQVVRDDRETADRALSMVYENCIGFDVCLACIVFYVSEQRDAMERFVRSPPPPNECFTVDFSKRYCGIRVTRGEELSNDECRPPTTSLRNQFTVSVAPVGSFIAVYPYRASNDTPLSTQLFFDNRIQPLSIVRANAHPRADDDVCAICLDSLASGGEVIQTTCHHWFHKACLLDHYEHTTLQNVQSCPMCRAAMPRRVPDEAATVMSENTVHITLSDHDVAEHRQLLFVALLRPQYQYWTDVAALMIVDL